MGVAKLQEPDSEQADSCASGWQTLRHPSVRLGVRRTPGREIVGLRERSARSRLSDQAGLGLTKLKSAEKQKEEKVEARENRPKSSLCFFLPHAEEKSGFALGASSSREARRKS